MSTFAVIKAILTFGPDVVSLLGELIEAIKKAGAGKDRKAAERVLYMQAWAIRNGVPYPTNGHK
jgi:hypothetical protein